MIELRPISVADAAELAAIHGTCFAENWTAVSFTSLLTSVGVFGIVGGLKKAGWDAFILARVAADEAEILTLCTLPAARRFGMASLLVHAALEEARRRGASRVFLEVAENNAAALSLYTKFGFAAVGRRRRYYFAPGSAPSDALTLSLTLPL